MKEWYLAESIWGGDHYFQECGWKEAERFCERHDLLLLGKCKGTAGDEDADHTWASEMADTLDEALERGIN